MIEMKQFKEAKRILKIESFKEPKEIKDFIMSMSKKIQ